MLQFELRALNAYCCLCETTALRSLLGVTWHSCYFLHAVVIFVNSFKTKHGYKVSETDMFSLT